MSAPIRVLAIVVLALLGAASSSRAAGLDAKNWGAWINRMPPGPASLHVVGNLMLSNPGQVPVLKPATPQGTNERVLILDLTMDQKPGMWPQVILPGQARYDAPNYTTKPPHSQVTIRTGGQEITIDVYDVH